MPKDFAVTDTKNAAQIKVVATYRCQMATSPNPVVLDESLSIPRFNEQTETEAMVRLDHYAREYASIIAGKRGFKSCELKSLGEVHFDSK